MSEPAEWLISSRSPLYRGMRDRHLGLDVLEHLVGGREITTCTGPSPIATGGFGGGGGVAGWPRPPRPPRPPDVGSDAMLLVTMASSSFTRLFGRRAADVAGADVMVVGVDAGHFAIEVDALYPILLPRPAPAAASGRRVGIDGGGGGGSLLRSVEMLLPYPPGLRAAMMVLPSVPSQMPTLNGMPSGVCSGESGPPTRGAGCHPDESFCVEKPFTPACARMLGSEAGKPKQSGSMYSSLALPNSLRK